MTPLGTLRGRRPTSPAGLRRIVLLVLALASMAALAGPASAADPPVLTTAGSYYSPERSFSPNGDGQEDSIGFGYCLANQAANLTIKVLNAAGAAVRTLENGVSHPVGCGYYAGYSNWFSWDGRNDAGVVMADGAYTFSMRAVDANNQTADLTSRTAIDTRLPGRLSQPAPNATLTGTAAFAFVPTAGFPAITQLIFSGAAQWIYAADA
ncbi:MAG: FlgD immunoglobulin-like domain containing protein, partial [Acidimicrobiales bacterium]